jgi:DedD protein
MPLPSFLERFRRGASGTTPAARAPSPSDVEALRTRARRRLIGMVVLVGAGVLGLPWLFETQPRPMSPDVRIVQAGSHAGAEAETPSRATSGRVAQVPPRETRVVNITPPANTPDTPSANAEPPSQVRAGAASDARAEGRSEPAKVPPKTSAADPTRLPDKAPAKPADKAPAKAPEKAAEKPAKPVVKPAEKPADKKPEPKAADNRYVVQFGAFADVNAAREARQKAERMGLKTYAQQVDTPQGKRIRVRLGPFADKAEADKALATLRKGGLNGNVLTL